MTPKFEKTQTLPQFIDTSGRSHYDILNEMRKKMKEGITNIKKRSIKTTIKAIFIDTGLSTGKLMPYIDTVEMFLAIVEITTDRLIQNIIFKIFLKDKQSEELLQKIIQTPGDLKKLFESNFFDIIINANSPIPLLINSKHIKSLSPVISPEMNFKEIVQQMRKISVASGFFPLQPLINLTGSKRLIESTAQERCIKKQKTAGSNACSSKEDFSHSTNINEQNSLDVLLSQDQELLVDESYNQVDCQAPLHANSPNKNLFFNFYETGDLFDSFESDLCFSEQDEETYPNTDIVFGLEHNK